MSRHWYLYLTCALSFSMSLPCVRKDNRAILSRLSIYAIERARAENHSIIIHRGESRGNISKLEPETE